MRATPDQIAHARRVFHDTPDRFNAHMASLPLDVALEIAATMMRDPPPVAGDTIALTHVEAAP